MTPEEKAEVQLETRLECARIAALESQYWGSVEDDRPHMSDICIGAMGSAANICGALFMGQSEAEFREQIERRDLPISEQFASEDKC